MASSDSFLSPADAGFVIGSVLVPLCGAACCGFIYCKLVPGKSFAWRLLTKGTAVATFLLAAGASYVSNETPVAGPSRELLAVALGLSAAGDFFLLGIFIPGLVAFALAHVLFMASFAATPGLDLVFAAKYALAPLLTLLAGLNLVVLRRMALSNGRMLMAVRAYSFIIAAMSFTAAATRDVDLIVASILFFLSDLGIVLAAATGHWTAKASIVLYFSAQMLFACSLSGRRVIFGKV